jgi:signal transduction histidine kinase
MFDAIPAGARFWNFVNDREPYRAIILRNVAILDTEEGESLPLPKLTVIFAAPIEDIRQQLTNLGILIAIVSLMILIPTLYLAVWSIRRALAPLNDLTAAARTVSVDRWQFEPSQLAQSTDELQPLILAIQTVLGGLEAAFTRQRQFLGDAAHELKTSLAILKSTLQAQLNKPREKEEYQRGLAMMSGDCDRLERLLNRMLQTARAEQRIANGPERGPESLDLATTCEEAIARLAHFAAAREVAIDFTSSAAAQVQAEAADLELIWLNLLENAVQYSPSGSSIDMSLTVAAGWGMVEVADRGCGIEPAHLPHIFERFYRPDSSRARSTGGSGLGLAITKSLVDFYGGRIHVESEPARGTRITVELPLCGESAGSERPVNQPVQTVKQ